MGVSPQMCWSTLTIPGCIRQTNNTQPLGNTVYCLHSADSSLLWYKKYDINAVHTFLQRFWLLPIGFAHGRADTSLHARHILHDLCKCSDNLLLTNWQRNDKLILKGLEVPSSNINGELQRLKPASGYHTTPAKPHRNTNTHRTRAIQPMK